MFALVDCNSFYASCERVFRPDLLGKPIVVLSNNDGCVISRSSEAKAVGVPMGTPAYQSEELFKQHRVNVFSANFSLYGDMSQRIMTILSEYTPDMEVYSIDEAFLKFDETAITDLQAYGQSIVNRLKKWTGLPVSIGIAPTKSLAKVANSIAKKFPEKTGGVYLIDKEEKRIKALKWLPIHEVWGIGRRHSKRLYSMLLKTAFDFTQLPNAWVKKNMSITGVRLQRDLQGIPTLQLEKDIGEASKSILVSRSFEHNYTQLHELQERISTFTASCAEKLRKQHSHCNSLLLFLHTNRNRKDLPQSHQSIFIQTPFPTNSTLELVKLAIQALDKIFVEGYAYKKAGIIVMDLTPENSTQLNFFKNSHPKHASLMQTIDKLNTTYGQQKIRLAAQDLQRVWKMKQESLSPRYTTQINEVLHIHT